MEQRQEAQEILHGRDPGEDVTAVIEDRSRPSGAVRIAGPEAGSGGGAPTACGGIAAKACGKSFNALTGTPLARLRHKERWLDFARSLKEGDTVRASAGRCDVAVGTAFRWRHRFLRALKAAAAPLRGIVKADETYLLDSRKGDRHLDRQPRKRGGKAAKRGLSRHRRLKGFLAPIRGIATKYLPTPVLVSFAPVSRPIRHPRLPQCRPRLTTYSRRACLVRTAPTLRLAFR